MFTYQQLQSDIEYLSYNGGRGGVLGKSQGGYDIPFVHYGKPNGKQIIISGGIHARENVSALMVIRQAFYLIKKSPIIDGGIYFIPMVNVDGALLIEKGCDFFPEQRQFLVEANGGSTCFSLWKAGISGVDLNTNFDADFGRGINNVHHPAPSDYVGKKPFDQPETLALSQFTERVKPSLTVSYHALGRELYWFFNQTTNRERDEAIAERVNKKLGYKKIDETLGSVGGYKDWCIQRLSIPSLTIELGSSSASHPLTSEDIEEDWQLNKNLPEFLLSLV